MLKQRLALTVDAAGAATVYSLPFSGVVAGIYFEIGTLTSGAVDITITAGEENAPILALTNLSASAWYYPKVGTCSVTGVAALYAAGGAAVLGHIPVDGQFKIVVADGGNKTTGHITFYVKG